VSGTAESLVLPAGTVTFLLSDIEGSSRLWETEPEAMAQMVPAVYAILDEAVAGHGGVRPVEQGEGDSVVGAFARASDAVGAALEGQLALHRQVWPGGIDVRVRIAVHTAEAQLRDEGNYFGVALSRCARLRAIAQGGQTLLSRAAHDLVADRLPAGAGLVDCGVHRLRDLGRPEHVFALVHAALPDDQRPLRSLDALPNNLPAQLTSFVGRVRDLEEVSRALGETRLLTLTGAGGSGKTRLALQVAADALELFPDGVWWVDLSQVTDPGLVGDAVAAAVGVRASVGMSAVQVSCAHLAGRRALIVLDNCEHVLEDAATVATTVISACAEVSVLATSRAPLGVGGETDWRVPSLSLPPREPAGEQIEVLSGCDSVPLFVERARKVRPNFALVESNAPAVAQICHELDGIPLAIELAAARIRMLTAEQISAGLVDRFHLLTGGERAALPRQRTLRASVDWSHDLLADDERALLRRLGAFVGGFSLDAAECVGGGEGVDAYAVLDLLSSLVDNSLVQAEEHGPLVRYRLLQSVRQYALDRLTEAGERGPTLARHRDWFLALAEQAAPALETSRQQEWLDVVDRDAANFVAALERSTPTDGEQALRLAVALTTWWFVRGRYAEADAGYAQALAAGADAPTRLRARAFWGRAARAAQAGESDAAREYGETALSLADAEGDASTAARALTAMGLSELFADAPRARVQLTRAVALARAASDTWAETDATQLVAFTYFFQDDHEACARELDRIEEIVARSAPPYQVARQALTRGMLAEWAGRLRDARDLFERGLTASLGEPVMAGFLETELARIDMLEGHADAALARVFESLQRALSTGGALVIPVLHIQAAWAERALGRFDDAYARISAWLPTIEGAHTYLVTWGEALRADLARRTGDLATAQEAALHGLAVANKLNNAYQAGNNRLVLGRLAAARGEWALAEQHAHALLDACAEGGHHTFAPDALDALAEAAAGAGRPADAARLLAAAARARRDLGTPRSTGEDQHWDALTNNLRGTLEDEFDTAWRAGSALSVEQSIAWVRRAHGERKRPAIGWESLTSTEERIVELATQGLTNPKIGERMFISRTTVKTHLAHIYAKLGIHSRTELAVAATAKERELSL
jgi:predicted ATPase/class 3 adenylate cyclase/DNA-binding CsgD family transcriptional regulator